MARHHAVTKTSITNDEDFLALTHDAKFLYWWLLVQPKLTLAGTLDLRVKTWARQSPDTDADDIESYLVELEKAGYVIVDHDTDELMIRTFLVHDMSPARASESTIKGIWNAWAGVESKFLRRQIVAMFPDDLWTKAEAHAPDEAMQTRRSLPFERGDGFPLERDDAPPFERESDPPFEPPATCLLPPATAAAAAPSAAPGSNGDAVETSTAEPVAPALDAAARKRRIAEAVDVLTERHLAVTPSKTNAAGHRKAVHAGKLADHLQAAHQALVADPRLSASALADVLEPPAPDPPPTSGLGEVGLRFRRDAQERAEQLAREDARLARELAVPGSATRIQETLAATRSRLHRNGVTP